MRTAVSLMLLFPDIPLNWQTVQQDIETRGVIHFKCLGPQCISWKIEHKKNCEFYPG